LRKSAEKLGDLLHARGEWVAPDDAGWAKTASELHQTYELAWQCSRGTLLSPMFLVDGHVVGKMMIGHNDDAHAKILTSMKEGAEGILKVDYLDSVPDDWQSDLAI